MPNQHHCCSVCERPDIKLYRYYGRQLRDEEIFCKADAPEGEIDRQLLVPLIEAPDGSVWGHFAAPAPAIARREAPPEE